MLSALLLLQDIDGCKLQLAEHGNMVVAKLVIEDRAGNFLGRRAVNVAAGAPERCALRGSKVQRTMAHPISMVPTCEAVVVDSAAASKTSLLRESPAGSVLVVVKKEGRMGAPCSVGCCG